MNGRPSGGVDDGLPPVNPRTGPRSGLPTGDFAGPLAVLHRIRAARPAGRPPSPPGGRCEMCAAAVGAAHGHVVDLDSRALMCTCRACYLLFDYERSELAYRSVRDRYGSFPDFRLTRRQWDDLAVPVGLAFFFRNSRQDRTVACYPGPAGAAESELPLGAWDAVVEANPALAAVAPDVEAILVRDHGSGFEGHLVPIDACYELVGRLRQVWRGFDGGQEARAALDEFFAGVQRRSRPIREAVRKP